MEHFKDSLFRSVINFNVKLKEASSFGKSIVDYDKKSRGFKDYSELAAEVIEEQMIVEADRYHEAALLPLESKTVDKRFVFHAPEAESVSIVGNFNNWVPSENYRMNRNEDGTWSKVISLEPGQYQYKYVVDGLWIEDNRNPKISIDPYGGRNSVIEVF
jgi:1,4-alpha-glucan branching enzyme